MSSFSGLGGDCDSVADDPGFKNAELINLCAAGRMIAKMVARAILVAEMNRFASKFFHLSWCSEKSTNKGENPICTPNERASIAASIGRFFWFLPDAADDEGPRIDSGTMLQP